MLMKYLFLTRKPSMKWLIIALLPAFVFLSACSSRKAYIYNEGPVYGTYYHVVYESPDGTDFHEEIKAKFQEFDLSFSTFNPESVISKINNNQPVEADIWFTRCFEKAQEISDITQGAFDITVAPLVNAWGFGFREKEKVTAELIDSLLQLTGYKKVRLENGQVIKENPGTMLDMSAIAKGYTSDLIADFLKSKGCENYMVEIGGEVVAKGRNAKGLDWKIGISKPDETGLLTSEELQAIVKLPDHALATSGNYRNFYVEDGKKYAHTINPATGYPVQHSLLSATVLANDCMTADAFATAFMVMGLEKSGTGQ
ncbi:thiamine biosynthesis lipoprotein ApbE [Bacteroidales bacterium 6E]|nr:thiamine biosynthesis lipoprotein ApbE [Bacteroidales bacterium 6E]